MGHLFSPTNGLEADRRGSSARLSRCLAIIIAVFLSIAMPERTRAEDAPVKLDLSGMELTFSEEFDSLSVSPNGPNTRWTAHTPWNGDFGDARFADPRIGVFPFTTNDGILRIEARKNPDGKWESGLLCSTDARGKGFSQQYGYFEMKAKLPPGKGVWPAFWLHTIPDEKADSDVEIDVIEYYGHNSVLYQSVVHTWFKDKNDSQAYQPPPFFTKVPPDSLTDNYNTYGVMVGPEWIEFYWNRVQVWRTKTPVQLNRPLHILLNLALGSGYPIDETPNPSLMYVDYIHVYGKRKS